MSREELRAYLGEVATVSLWPFAGKALALSRSRVPPRTAAPTSSAWSSATCAKWALPGSKRPSSAQS